MANFGSPFPFPVPPRSDAQEAEISIQAEPAPGEVTLDAVVRAQSTAPQVITRITELENCLWALAEFLERGGPEEERRALLERARECLKARLEIDDALSPADDNSLTPPPRP